MGDAQLQALFGDAMIAGHYADGRTFNEHYKADGSLHYQEQRRPEPWTGHWSVIRGRFCTIYNEAGSGGCFRVHQVSSNCFEFYFETRTEDEARRSTPGNPTWTARGWRIDRPITCEDRPTV